MMDHLRWLLAPLEGRVKLKTSRAFCPSRLTPRLTGRGDLEAGPTPHDHPAPITLVEALDTTRINSGAGLTGARAALVTTCLCRAPHYTTSDAGPIGGGHVSMSREVSLAHHGVLFLDAWPEFRRHVLEVWRQPLEGGVIYI
jgi:Magnesium chelatase, subunit ChlI